MIKYLLVLLAPSLCYTAVITACAATPTPILPAAVPSDTPSATLATAPSPTSQAIIPTLTPANNGYPQWVGTPASGSHPRSDQPLPAGIANGDIIESGNLLWFIWENTKSRIWFPNGEAYLSLFQEGSDRTRHLQGVTPVPDRWEIVFRKVLNQNQIQQVYLADRTSHIIYPLKHPVIPWDQAEKIPTAIGDQYFPILAENEKATGQE